MRRTILNLIEEDRPGEDAQPEVKKAINRFYEEGHDEKGEILLYWLLGEGTPDFKLDPEDANYTPKSKKEGQRCGNCEFLYLKAAAQPKRWICSQLSGRVRPQAWCDRWKRIDV